MTNIGFMAVFPAMLFCVCVGLPLIWLQLFITSSRKDNYIKKAHKVKGKEVSHKYVQGVSSDVSTNHYDKEDEVWACYTYEWKGRTYKHTVKYLQNTYLNLKSKEIDLYFLKNPKKVAINEQGLADTQAHWLRTIIIIFIIGFVLYY